MPETFPALPLRVAVIGSGPSGFYAAGALLDAELPVQVDMFEKLALPFGLVRFGVAPDHMHIRLVARVFEKTAHKEDFRLFCNVAIGSGITIEELRQRYDAIIFATGAGHERKLDIPGEGLDNCFGAVQFVGWYNGHPAFRDLEVDLTQPTAVVIGNGNVAIDVARILARTEDELRQTDICEHALESLRHSQVRDIYVFGRRGPAQAAFTYKEASELARLSGCDAVTLPEDLELGDTDREELEAPENHAQNDIVAALRQMAGQPRRHPRQVQLRFCYSPVEIRGQQRVESIVLERNRLDGPAFEQQASGTGETIEIPCGLVLRSIGYKGTRVAGVPFDERRGVFPNQGGRIHDETGEVVPGLYAVGWIRRGPRGVIGTNRPDSNRVIDKLIEDAPGLPPAPIRDPAEVPRLLAERQVRVVDFADWQRVDAAEKAQGEEIGRPRRPFTSTEEVLAFLDGTSEA